MATHLASNFFSLWLKIASPIDVGSQSPLVEAITTNQTIVEKAARCLGIMQVGSESHKAWKSVKEAVEVAVKGSDSDVTTLWTAINTCFKLLLEELRKHKLDTCANICIFIFSSVAVMSMMTSGQGVNCELLQQFLEIAVDLPPNRFDSEYADSVAKCNDLVIKAMTEGTLTGDDASQLIEQLYWQVNDLLAHFKSFTEPPIDSGLPRCSSLRPSRAAAAAGVSAASSTMGFQPTVQPASILSSQPVSSFPAVLDPITKMNASGTTMNASAMTTDASVTKTNAPTVTLPSLLIGTGPTVSEIMESIASLNPPSTASSSKSSNTSTTTTTTTNRAGILSDGYSQSNGTVGLEEDFGDSDRLKRHRRPGGLNDSGNSTRSAATTEPANEGTIEKADEEDTKESDDKDRESEKGKKSVQVVKSVEHSSSVDRTGGSGLQHVGVEIQDKSQESREHRGTMTKGIHLPEEGEEITAEKYSEILDSLPLQEAANLVIKVSDNLKQLWLEDVEEVTNLLANKEGVSTSMKDRLEFRKAKLQEELETIAENRQHAKDFLDYHQGLREAWPACPLKRQLNEEELKDGAVTLQQVDPEVLHDIMKQVTNPVGQDMATSEQGGELVQSWYILLPEFNDAEICSLAQDLGIEIEGKDRSGLLAAITNEWSRQGFDTASFATQPNIQPEQQPQTPSHLSSEDTSTEAVSSGEQAVKIEIEGDKGDSDNVEENDEKEEDESENSTAD